MNRAIVIGGCADALVAAQVLARAGREVMVIEGKHSTADEGWTPPKVMKALRVQGELSLQQMFFLRPVPAWAKYRTPIADLWQCGAGTHPGGGVMGASGRNAARAILGST